VADVPSSLKALLPASRRPFFFRPIIDASNVVPIGVTPHIVRVNAHPGSVE